MAFAVAVVPLEFQYPGVMRPETDVRNVEFQPAVLRPDGFTAQAGCLDRAS
jgi:hypothetical protein